MRNPFENKGNFPHCLRNTEKYEKHIQKLHNLERLEGFLHSIVYKTYDLSELELYNIVVLICFSAYLVHSTLQLNEVFILLQKVKDYMQQKSNQTESDSAESEDSEDSDSTETSDSVSSSSADF